MDSGSTFDADHLATRLRSLASTMRRFLKGTVWVDDTGMLDEAADAILAQANASAGTEALLAAELATLRTERDAAVRETTELRESVESLRAGGAGLIATERRRQIETEGWTEAHDAEHNHGELYRAAMAYLKVVHYPDRFGPGTGDLPDNWPWDAEWWKPSDDPIRNLVKAGALIAAEIDRRARLAVHSASSVASTPSGDSQNAANDTESET